MQSNSESISMVACVEDDNVLPLLLLLSSRWSRLSFSKRAQDKELGWSMQSDNESISMVACREDDNVLYRATHGYGLLRTT